MTCIKSKNKRLSWEKRRLIAPAQASPWQQPSGYTIRPWIILSVIEFPNGTFKVCSCFQLRFSLTLSTTHRFECSEVLLLVAYLLLQRNSKNGTLYPSGKKLAIVILFIEVAWKFYFNLKLQFPCSDISLFPCLVFNGSPRKSIVYYWVYSIVQYLLYLTRPISA